MYYGYVMEYPDVIYNGINTRDYVSTTYKCLISEINNLILNSCYLLQLPVFTYYDCGLKPVLLVICDSVKINIVVVYVCELIRNTVNSGFSSIPHTLSGLGGQRPLKN